MLLLLLSPTVLSVVVIQDERFNKNVDKMTGYLTRSILCMPLLRDGQV